MIGEIDVTSRSKLAVSAFYVNNQKDFGTFKIIKLKYHARYGWREDCNIQVNHFQLAQINEFLSIISSLDLSDAQKTRISLENIHVGALGTLLSSSSGVDLIKELASTPELRQDIYADECETITALMQAGRLTGSDASSRARLKLAVEKLIADFVERWQARQTFTVTRVLDTRRCAGLKDDAAVGGR
jgi:hypothetical protein